MLLFAVGGVPMVNPLSESSGENHHPQKPKSSPREEKIHQKLHPGQSAPETVLVPKSYVWSACPENIDPNRVVLYNAGGSLFISFIDPRTEDEGFAELPELPETVDELKTSVRAALRDSGVEEEDLDQIELLPAEESKVDQLLAVIESTGKLQDAIDFTREQLENSLHYINDNRDELIEKAAADSHGMIFLRPKDQDLEVGCHLQVSADGSIILIPKRKELFLGEGSEKRLRLGIEESSGKLVAAISSKEEVKVFLKEVELLKTLDPNLVRYTLFDEGKRVKGKAAIPYARHGDLEKALKGTLPVEKKKIMELLAEQVARLHEKEIIIRDLKPANVLLGEEEGELSVWILDLGLADFKKNSSVEQLLDATPHIMPPEALSYEWFKTEVDDPLEKVDIYALGMTLFAMGRGSETELLPWLDARDLSKWKQMKNKPVEAYKEAFLEYAKKHPEAALDENFSPKNLTQLIAWATHWDPKRRPTAEQIAQALASLS